MHHDHNQPSARRREFLQKMRRRQFVQRPVVQEGLPLLRIVHFHCLVVLLAKDCVVLVPRPPSTCNCSWGRKALRFHLGSARRADSARTYGA